MLDHVGVPVGQDPHLRSVVQRGGQVDRLVVLGDHQCRPGQTRADRRSQIGSGGALGQRAFGSVGQRDGELGHGGHASGAPDQPRSTIPCRTAALTCRAPPSPAARTVLQTAPRPTRSAARLPVRRARVASALVSPPPRRLGRHVRPPTARHAGAGGPRASHLPGPVVERRAARPAPQRAISLHRRPASDGADRTRPGPASDGAGRAGPAESRRPIGPSPARTPGPRRRPARRTARRGTRRSPRVAIGARLERRGARRARRGGPRSAATRDLPRRVRHVGARTAGGTRPQPTCGTRSVAATGRALPPAARLRPHPCAQRPGRRGVVLPRHRRFTAAHGCCGNGVPPTGVVRGRTGRRRPRSAHTWSTPTTRCVRWSDCGCRCPTTPRSRSGSCCRCARRSNPLRSPTRRTCGRDRAPGFDQRAEADLLLALRRGHAPVAAASTRPRRGTTDRARGGRRPGHGAVRAAGHRPGRCRHRGARPCSDGPHRRRAVAHAEPPPGAGDQPPTFDLATVCELYVASDPGRRAGHGQPSSPPWRQAVGRWSASAASGSSSTLPSPPSCAAATRCRPPTPLQLRSAAPSRSTARRWRSPSVAPRPTWRNVLRRATRPHELPEPDGLEATLRPVPASRRGLDGRDGRAGPRRCAGRRHGAGQDHPAHRRCTCTGCPRAGPAPTLVVCPATLVGNWQRELARFAPGCAVQRYHGADRTLAPSVTGDVVVTTYGIVRRDATRLGCSALGARGRRRGPADQEPQLVDRPGRCATSPPLQAASPDRHPGREPAD